MDQAPQQVESDIAADATGAAAAAVGAQDDGEEENLLKQAIAMSMADGEEFENMRVRYDLEALRYYMCYTLVLIFLSFTGNRVNWWSVGISDPLLFAWLIVLLLCRLLPLPSLLNLDDFGREHGGR